MILIPHWTGLNKFSIIDLFLLYFGLLLIILHTITILIVLFLYLDHQNFQINFSTYLFDQVKTFGITKTGLKFYPYKYLIIFNCSILQMFYCYLNYYFTSNKINLIMFKDYRISYKTEIIKLLKYALQIFSRVKIANKYAYCTKFYTKKWYGV